MHRDWNNPFSKTFSKKIDILTIEGILMDSTQWEMVKKRNQRLRNKKIGERLTRQRKEKRENETYRGKAKEEGWVDDYDRALERASKEDEQNRRDTEKPIKPVKHYQKEYHQYQNGEIE